MVAKSLEQVLLEECSTDILEKYIDIHLERNKDLYLPLLLLQPELGEKLMRLDSSSYTNGFSDCMKHVLRVLINNKLLEIEGISKIL